MMIGSNIVPIKKGDWGTINIQNAGVHTHSRAGRSLLAFLTGTLALRHGTLQKQGEKIELNRDDKQRQI